MTSTMPTSAPSDSMSAVPPDLLKAVLSQYDPSTGAAGERTLSLDELKKLQDKDSTKEIVDWVKGEYKKCKSAHAGIRSQWYMNLAFYKGDQYVQQLSGQVVRTRAPQRRVRLVINRVRPMIRAAIAQLTAREPFASVVPASGETEDVLAAESAQAVFENVAKQYKLRKAKTYMAFWQTVCGVGYIKTRWNADGYNGLGCHEFSVPSPFHILVPELMVPDIEDQPYVINVYTKPIQWVKDNFGDLLPKDYQGTVVSTNEIMETQYLNLKNSDRRAEPDASLFIEMWVKPGVSKNFPNGGMVTVMDDILVEACLDCMPYNHDEFPFTKFDGIPSGGYYTTSAIEDYIQLQMELNRNRSQRTEARNFTSKPQWISPRGVIDVSKWRNEPGQVLEYIPGMGKPEPMPMPNLPEYVIKEEEAILRDMEDVSGQHQISRGQNPSGVTSGTAISFLQETDNSFGASFYKSIEFGYEKLARQVIMIAVQFWDYPRTVKVNGGNSFSVKELMGSDLKSGTDVQIEPDSGLPYSKAARIAMFMDLMKNGLIPAQDGLRLLEIPGMQAFYDRVDVDKKQAEREDQKMMEFGEQGITMYRQEADAMKQEYLAMMGMDEQTALMNRQVSQNLEQFDKPIIPVNEYDNHEAHLEEHAFFMKTQQFENQPQVVKDEVLRHWKAHKEAQVQEQISMTMMQQGNPMENMAQQAMGGAGNNGSGINQFSGAGPADSGGNPASQLTLGKEPQ